MEQSELERVTRMALKDIGWTQVDLALHEDEGHPGQWLMDVRGPNGRNQLRIRCGPGTTAQFVREQVFQQMV